MEQRVEQHLDGFVQGWGLLPKPPAPGARGAAGAWPFCGCGAAKLPLASDRASTRAVNVIYESWLLLSPSDR